MTPAILSAKNAKIDFTVHEYQHDQQHQSYGLEAAQKLAVPAQQVFKTLVVKLDTAQLAVAILPVEDKLSMKAVAKALGTKKAEMADPLAVQRSSGYVLGGVSPLGQKKSLKTIIHQSAQNFATIYVSAGRRGLEIELKATDLQKLTRASFAAISQ